jgi:hypothetical protein
MGKDNDDDDAMATARAKAAHERGVNVKMISTARPATAAVEMDASEALLKRDGKDVYKKSSAKKARYAMLFPGQLSATKEGKIGEMREMHTQSPVVYLDFAVGRMKLLGSIVRPTSTRYFTLNAKSKDRMNLEEWFDSVIVFPSWYWIGTREENPEEKPLPLPEALGDLAGAPETDWRASVAAETSGKTSKETTTTATTTTATTTAKGANTATDAKENAANDANGGRRPRRQAATAARKKMYADDSDVEEESDDDDDGRVTSPVVIRGKVESFMPAPSPAKPPAVRPSVDAPSRPSASAQKKTKEPPAKRQKKEPVIVIDSEDDDEEDSDRDDDDDDDDEEMELDDESEGESEESEDDDDDDSDFE